MEDILLFITGADFKAWFAAVSAVIASASAITMLTPTKKDDKVYDFLMVILNFLSLNVLKNKNADDV